jgi:hypothetical protein
MRTDTPSPLCLASTTLCMPTPHTLDIVPSRLGTLSLLLEEMCVTSAVEVGVGGGRNLISVHNIR